MAEEAPVFFSGADLPVSSNRRDGGLCAFAELIHVANNNLRLVEQLIAIFAVLTGVR
jgi:hypothetical protein